MAKLASLEAKRDAKRRQVEALFEQQQAIQRHMDALHAELQALDDEIEAYEQELEEQVAIEEISYEQDEVHQEQPLTMTAHADEILTEPASLTMNPDEFLTEPEEVAAASAAALPARPSSSGSSGRGQLQITRTSTSTRRVVAAPPAGLQRTSDASRKTLEDYFGGSSTTDTAAYMDVPESFRPNAPANAQVLDLLHNTFRIPSFRGHQEEIITATLSGKDVFVIMRTGGGKSLTYQLPAILEGRGPQRKITLVVSPLLSLIRDQEDQMNAFCPGSAISFSSNIGKEEHARRWEMVRDASSGVCLILVTPEKIHKSNKIKTELQKLFEHGRLGRFVIDECHCACQWGHDFRPDYTKLGLLKTHFPSIPLMAVTATASDRVREDCCQILRLGTNYEFFRSTAHRPNLTYSVCPKTTRVVDDMADFIKEQHARNAGIIYTFSRKEADDLADKLCERGIVARAYHSSVSDSAKDYIHKSWMRNETQVVVATIAFGLGINKPDVRFVLHQTVSKSLEGYYQESGRAGRDGNPADCVLFYSPKDVARMICMIHGQNGEHAFWTMVRYAQASGNDPVCKAVILKSLGEPNSPDVNAILDENNGITTDEKDVGVHAKTVTELLRYKANRGDDVTVPMLVKEWRSRTPPDCVKSNPPGKELTVDDCERIVICLLLENVISPNVVWNAHCSTMYLKLGSRAHALLESQSPKVYVRLPVRPAKAARASKAKPAVANEDGWIQTKKKRKPPPDGKKKAKKPKEASKEEKKTEIIELLDVSSDEEDEEPILNTAGRVSWQNDPDSSESEFELE